MDRLLNLIAILGAVLAPAMPSRAADISVTAAVSSARVAIGDTLVYQITVDGAEDATSPDLSGLDGFSARYAGGAPNSSHSSFRINGQRQDFDVKRYVMQWQLSPTRKGKLTIPSVQVKVGAQTYSTSPVSISAFEPTESPDFKLKLEADKAIAYVGEPVKVRLTWLLGKKVQRVQFSGADGGQVFDIAPGPDPRPGGREDQRYPVLPFLGTQAVGRIGKGDMDGSEVTALTIDLIVTPRKAGQVEVGPYSAAFEAVVGQRQPSFFDAPWDDRNITEHNVVASNTLTFDVRDVPEAGKPASFSGLIGNYGVSAAAGATEANVGDPIPLTVTISGPEPMSSVHPPDLASLPGFDAFKLAPEGWQAGDKTKPGERTFTTTIRPRTDSITQIPPVELAFFDTAKGQYNTSASAALPLKVSPTREITSADAIGTRPATPPSPSVSPAKPIESLPEGIHANYEDGDVLVNQDVGLLLLIRTPAGLALVAGPPVLAVATMIATRRRLNTPAAGRRRALSQARGILRGADSHEQVSLALRSYLGGALGVEPAAITSSDCPALLRQAGSSLGDRSERLLGECERARFGPLPRPASEARAEATSLLADLSSELGRLS